MMSTTKTMGLRASGFGLRARNSDVHDGGLVSRVLGGVADATIGTALVLWHAALARRERRRPPARLWSSTR